MDNRPSCLVCYSYIYCILSLFTRFVNGIFNGGVSVCGYDIFTLIVVSVSTFLYVGLLI